LRIKANRQVGVEGLIMEVTDVFACNMLDTEEMERIIKAFPSLMGMWKPITVPEGQPATWRREVTTLPNGAMVNVFIVYESTVPIVANGPVQKACEANAEEFVLKRLAKQLAANQNPANATSSSSNVPASRPPSTSGQGGKPDSGRSDRGGQDEGRAPHRPVRSRSTGGVKP